MKDIEKIKELITVINAKFVQIKNNVKGQSREESHNQEFYLQEAEREKNLFNLRMIEQFNKQKELEQQASQKLINQ